MLCRRLPGRRRLPALEFSLDLGRHRGRKVAIIDSKARQPTVHACWGQTLGIPPASNEKPRRCGKCSAAPGAWPKCLDERHGVLQDKIAAEECWREIPVHSNKKDVRSDQRYPAKPHKKYQLSEPFVGAPFLAVVIAGNDVLVGHGPRYYTVASWMQ